MVGSKAALVLLVSILMMSGLACSDNPLREHPQTGTVEGRVFFEDTDRTIPKVIVSLGNQEYKTVTNGEFEFTGVRYGSYTIQAAKGGYVTHISEVMVDAPRVEHNIDLWFAPDD